MSGIQLMMVGAKTPPPIIPYALSWSSGSNYGDTTTVSSSTVVTATTSTNGNGYGYFSSQFPTGVDCYVDVVLAAGYPGTVSFLGVSNQVSAFNYSAYPYYKAWYWSGSWFGDGTNYVTPPTSLDADTYRIALRPSIGRLYIKRSGNATVASADLPSGSAHYLVVLPQQGFITSGATIVNGFAYSGSGGLY